MDFVRGAFILLCMLPKNIVLGLSLRMSSSYGLIHDAVFLNCSLDGATWSNTSLRQWRVSPPLTLLFNGGNPTTSATGYQEIISNVDTTGIFSLEITSLTWSHIGKQFECKYAFGTAVYTLTIAETEDYKNTILTQAEETIGLHIKGKITLDAIYPVPTVNATLITSSKTEDVKANALTNTTSAVSGNLKKVVINVDYVVSNAADYITVYLSTPGGYSNFSRFNTDVITTTAASTITYTTITSSNGSDNGSGLSGGAIAGIVIAVVIVCGVVVCVILIVIFKKKKNKGKNDSKNKKPKGRKSSTVGPIDTPEKKNGKWVEPNAQTAGRYSANSVTSRKDVVVDVQETKTNQGDNSEKSDTPRKLPPLPSKDSVTNDQEEKSKNKKKKKKKKKAKQEQNQQQEEGKDNTAFDNDQTENIPSDDTGNPKTKTTPKNIDSIPRDDLANLETNTSSNNHTIPSDDSVNPETTTPSNNHNIPNDGSGNPETTTPSNNHNIPSDDSGNPETTTPSNIDS